MARVSRKKQNLPIEKSEDAVRVWKTAIYVRLSVEDNGKDSDSVENQTALLEKYVSSHSSLEKAALFVDNGYTGTDFLRPEFTRMMEAVQSGTVDCIVVKDLSRLGRNYIKTSEFIEKICPFYGLRFIAVNDNYDTATVTSEGQLSASLANIVNDYYAKDISRKVTSSLKAKMERGDYIGNYAPHGYQKDPENKNHLIICPETAPVIRQIYEWRAEGISYMGINRMLNDAEIPSPSQYKIEHGIETNNNKKDHKILWNKHMVTDILHNIVYIGHLAQKKGSQCLYGGIPYHITDSDEWIVARNTHEPIISSELFDKVQQINRATSEKAKENSGKYDYLPKEKNIYGKKFVCGGCGCMMKLHRSVNRKKDKAYFTFKCPTYAEHGAKGCSDVKMRKADVDTAVLLFIKAQMDVFLDMENTLKRLLAMKKASVTQRNPAQEIRSLKQQLEKKQSTLSNLYIDLKDGFISQDEYGHHRAIVLADIEALQTHIAELSAVKEETDEQITGGMRWKLMVRQFYNATEVSEGMVNAFIESMVLHEDNTLEIKLNYMDELEALLATTQKLRKEVA